MYATSELVQLFPVRRVFPVIARKCGVRGHAQSRFRLDYGIVVGSKIVCRIAKLSPPKEAYINDSLVSPPDTLKVVLPTPSAVFSCHVVCIPCTARSMLSPVCHALMCVVDHTRARRGVGISSNVFSQHHCQQHPSHASIIASVLLLISSFTPHNTLPTMHAFLLASCIAFCWHHTAMVAASDCALSADHHYKTANLNCPPGELQCPPP